MENGQFGSDAKDVNTRMYLLYDFLFSNCSNSNALPTLGKFATVLDLALFKAICLLTELYCFCNLS